MELNDFAKVVDKTIPTDLDPDFDIDYSYGDVLFDEELELVNDFDVYKDKRVRVAILQSRELEYCGGKVPDNSGFMVFLFHYQKYGYTAQEFDGSMREVEELGGFIPFLYEVISNEKQVFLDRGSSVSM